MSKRGEPKLQYVGVLRVTQLWMAARFALSVLKANPVEASERMAIKKLEKALAETEKLDKGWFEPLKQVSKTEAK